MGRFGDDEVDAGIRPEPRWSLEDLRLPERPRDFTGIRVWRLGMERVGEAFAKANPTAITPRRPKDREWAP